MSWPRRWRAPFAFAGARTSASLADGDTLHLFVPHRFASFLQGQAVDRTRFPAGLQADYDSCSGDTTDQIDVFVSGQGGYHAYRIPSLLTMQRGSLLAFCEAHKNSRSDSGDIDLALRRSPDVGNVV